MSVWLQDQVVGRQLEQPWVEKNGTLFFFLRLHLALCLALAWATAGQKHWGKVACKSPPLPLHGKVGALQPRVQHSRCPARLCCSRPARTLLLQPLLFSPCVSLSLWANAAATKAQCSSRPYVASSGIRGHKTMRKQRVKECPCPTPPTSTHHVVGELV